MPPPIDWLKRVDFALADYFQRQLNDGTLLLYSVFDKSLLLVNSVLELRIDPKRFRYEEVQARIKDNGDLVKALQKLNGAARPLADLRNLYVHRGESRKMDLLDILKVIQSLEQRREVVVEQDVPLHLREQIVETMQSEISEIEILVEKVKGALLHAYSKRLEELGGVIMPSPEEARESIKLLETITDTIPAELKVAPEFIAGFARVH